MKHGNRGSLTQNEVQNISRLRPNISKQCASWRGQEMELENMAHVCCLLQLRSRRVLPLCCHSFHSHGCSLLAKPRISNLRVHVKSADMCVQLVSALSYITVVDKLKVQPVCRS